MKDNDDLVGLEAERSGERGGMHRRIYRRRNDTLAVREECWSAIQGTNNGGVMAYPLADRDIAACRAAMVEAIAAGNSKIKAAEAWLLDLDLDPDKTICLRGEYQVQ